MAQYNVIDGRSRLNMLKFKKPTFKEFLWVYMQGTPDFCKIKKKGYNLFTMLTNVVLIKIPVTLFLMQVLVMRIACQQRIFVNLLSSAF